MVEAEAEAEAIVFEMEEAEAEAEAVLFQKGLLEAEAEAVQKSTASASLLKRYSWTKGDESNTENIHFYCTFEISLYCHYWMKMDEIHELLKDFSMPFLMRLAKNIFSKSFKRYAPQNKGRIKHMEKWFSLYFEISL